MTRAYRVLTNLILVGPALAGPLLAERSRDDIPGVKLVGLAVGILLIVAAIRGMFGKRKR